MKKLYKFKWNFPYGIVDGLFIADEKDVENLYERTIDFGDILGRFSKVSGIVNYKDIEEISDCQGLVVQLEELFGKTISGYNPLEFLKREE